MWYFRCQSERNRRKIVCSILDIRSPASMERYGLSGHSGERSPNQTQPEAELQLLLKQLKLELPDQPPPKIAASGRLAK